MGAQLASVGVFVRDMARSLTFYEHLGFKFPPDAFGQPYVEETLPGGITIFWVDLQTLLTYAPDYDPSTRGGMAGLVFQLDQPEDVDVMFDRLKMLGHRGDRTPWDAPWGYRYAVVYDPDGNLVQLVSPHPEP